MKRFLSLAMIFMLLLSALVLPASAASAASRADAYITVHANGLQYCFGADKMAYTSCFLLQCINTWDRP